MNIDALNSEDLKWIKNAIESAKPSVLDVPKRYQLPKKSGYVPHELVIWYMEKLSSLGQPFGKFRTCFSMLSEQGKIIVDTMRCIFSPHPCHTDELPSYSMVWLTTPENIRQIYISTRCPSNFVPQSLDLISRRNVDALRVGKITPEHFAMAIAEIEIQLKMKHEQTHTVYRWK